MSNALGDLMHACPVPRLSIGWQGTMRGMVLQSPRENVG